MTGRSPTCPNRRGLDHLRAARPRLHRADPSAGPTRDLRRPDREDPVPEGARASPRSSCCRSTSSTRTTARSRTPRPASGCGTSGATTAIAFAAPKAAYAAAADGTARSASSATWSRPSTPPASRSSSTSSSTTPARATDRARPSASAARQRALLHTRPRRQYYMNFSGCGNTVNCNHPVVRELILECCALGHRHARGRLPLRPGVDPRPRTDGNAAGAARRR